jgi:hypothetical protein
MYDLIGDIHGHADELVRLLGALGYRRTRTSYRHPDRKAIFVGDFIDRGPKIREVLDIVRPMVEAGSALAIMGNHELNALGFHTEHPRQPGTYLRLRSDKNIRQHRATMEQLSGAELADALAWFRTLPLWLDLDGLRVIHACWDEKAIGIVAAALRQDGAIPSLQGQHGGINPAFLCAAHERGSELFQAVDTILKGKEAKLPGGCSFADKDDHVRTEIRTQWYRSPAGQTYGSYALQSDPIVCDVPLEASLVRDAAPYPAGAKPVFIGHYWLSADQPTILAENVACLDYSVAKGGYLCGYRWQGEQKLRNEHFVRT